MSWIVSILVFLELAPGHLNWTVHINGKSRFNPCFSGTRARTAVAAAGGGGVTSFNPCFSGTRARTEGRYNDAVVSV